MVATVNAAGSMLDYFDSPLYGELVRFAGLANGNISYLIQPGATFSSGAFINYDGQSINRNQTDGANAELAFSDPLISSIFRARVLDVQYLNGSSLIASPIFLTPAFNYTRTEGTWTGVVARNWPVAPYLEISGARVQYTDQPAPSLVNRSADDYHLKTGVRWTVSPRLPRTSAGASMNAIPRTASFPPTTRISSMEALYGSLRRPFCSRRMSSDLSESRPRTSLCWPTYAPIPQRPPICVSPE